MRFKTVFYYTLLFLVLFTIFSAPELIDLYHYYASGTCSLPCSITYRVENQSFGPHGHTISRKIVRVTITGGEASASSLEVKGTGFHVGGSGGGYECSGGYSFGGSPSFVYCSRSSSNRMEGYVMLTRRGSSLLGSKYLFVHGYENYMGNGSGLYIGASIVNTTCSFSCFEINMKYYSVMLLLKAIISAGLIVFLVLAKRLWGRENGDNKG